MKVFLLLFLQATAEAVQHGLRRSLEQMEDYGDGEDNNSNDDNGNYNNNNSGNERMDQMKEQWAAAEERVGEDLAGMWNTTPSEWGDEYWEVLLSGLLIVFSVLLCLCCVCCMPCCGSYEKPRTVATKADLEHRKALQEPILADEPVTKDHSSQRGRRDDQRNKNRRTLWQEIALVWQDFFTHGITVEDTKETGRNRMMRKRRSSTKRAPTRNGEFA